ncbi:MAG: stage II sporulation protein R [Clostridia bacterium]|nr:stage II sporulation protein R [Clostridia bacterium]
MKKFFCILLAATFIMCFMLTPRCVSCEFDKSDIYRLHIIANSNSYADQSVKLAVRDALLMYEKELFARHGTVQNAAEAKQLLMQNASQIHKIALEVLAKNGFYYGVKLSTGIYDFPDRTYKDTFYPAGKYDALRVVLGDGKGENWWCVMFPPLCIIDDSSGKSEDKEAETCEGDDVEFKSLFSVIGKWLAELFD